MRSIATSALVIALASCGRTFVVGDLPKLDARVEQACPTVTAKEGDNAKVIAKALSVARYCEASKRQQALTYIHGLEANRAQQ